MDDPSADMQAAPAPRPLPFLLRNHLGPLARSLPWHRPRLRVAAIMGSDARPLRLPENWERVTPALDALIALLPKPATIRPWHYHADRPGRPVAYGRLGWSAEANRRWTEAMTDPQIFMAKTELWSPSRSSTVERRLDPDFYVQLGWDRTGERQGFLLALRLELLPALADAANQVVAAVAAIMPDSETLVADRSWAARRILGVVRLNNLDDALAIDAFEWASENPARRVPAF
ncbi:MAG TPA: hypothetical protein VEC11_15645 [Allosphingosinicella sp.]|nr:hypothetical protein [Allosphingosinicella sp.]